MAQVINFNKKKAAKKVSERVKANANSLKYGRSKSQRLKESHEQQTALKKHQDHFREKPDP